MDSIIRKKIVFSTSVIALILVVSIIYRFLGSGDKASGTRFSGQKVSISIISKTGNNEDFFENARKKFIEIHPNIEINYISKSTFEAIDYIMKGNDINAWICGDETGVEILKERFRIENNGNDLVLEYNPIVTSPLVFVGWDERINHLGEISISTLYDMVSNSKTWKSVGGDENWGFINFSHTDPIKSNSGIQFIQLLIYDYYTKNNDRKKNLEISDIADNKLMEYIQKFEKNANAKEEGSGKFIQNFVLYGPSKCDIGAIYEYYALSNIRNAKGKWGNLKITYPNPTIWSNMPFVVLGGKSNKDQISASGEFMNYLRSKEVQEEAMKQGYRPANIDVTDMSIMEQEFSKFGFVKSVNQAVPSPDIKVVETIRSMIQKIK